MWVVGITIDFTNDLHSIKAKITPQLVIRNFVRLTVFYVQKDEFQLKSVECYSSRDL